MLPGRRRVGAGWEPALPLILAAWWETPSQLKHLRFLEHLEWADKHGCIDEVDAYLRPYRKATGITLEIEIRSRLLDFAVNAAIGIHRRTSRGLGERGQDLHAALEA